MTGADLIRALGDDLDIPRSKAEDILLAIRDLALGTLGRGEPFHLGELGFLAVNPRISQGKVRAAIIFQAAKKIRKALNVPEEALRQAQDRAGRPCKTCGIRPRKIFVYDDCDACQHARKRKERKEAKQ